MKNDLSQSWRELFSRCAPALLLYLRQRGFEINDAEDVIQDSFVNLIQRDQMPEHPVEYLYVVARNRSLDHRRRESRRQLREQAVVEQRNWFDTPTSPFENRDLVETGLRELPEQQREVIVLKIWSGLTFEAISRILGVSKNTAASRYRYAIENLKKAMDSRLKGENQNAKSCEL